VRALADIVQRPAGDVAQETSTTAGRLYGFPVNSP
jgi:hypothetical protein